MVVDDDEEEEEEDVIMDAAQRKSVAASKGVAAALQGQSPVAASSVDASGLRYGLGGIQEEMDQGGQQ
jgi:hypothetical protein